MRMHMVRTIFVLVVREPSFADNAFCNWKRSSHFLFFRSIEV